MRTRNQSCECREFRELQRLEADFEVLQFPRERRFVDQRRRTVYCVCCNALQLVQVNLQSRGKPPLPRSYSRRCFATVQP